LLLFILGYPNNPGPSFGIPGGLSLDNIVIVPQLGIGLAFAFRTDNQGYFEKTLFYLKN
jgi:hypothetical protein